MGAVALAAGGAGRAYAIILNPEFGGQEYCA